MPDTSLASPSAIKPILTSVIPSVVHVKEQPRRRQLAHNNPKRKQRDGQIEIEKAHGLRDKVLSAIVIVIFLFTLVVSALLYATFGDKIGAASVALAITQGIIHSPSTYAAYAIAIVVPLFLFVNAIAASLLVWIELIGHIRKFLNRS